MVEHVALTHKALIRAQHPQLSCTILLLKEWRAIYIRSVTFTKRQIMYMKSMSDFYKAVGLYDRFVSGEITNVEQMQMNSKDLDYLNMAIKRNLRRDPLWKHRTDRAIDTAAAMDWLNYSPCTNDEVPPCTIWVHAKD